MKRTSFFKKFDFFGRNYMFEENNSQSFNTNVGASFTLLLFTIIFVLAFLFGKEIYQKKSPYLMVSEEIDEKKEGYVEFDMFPIMFVFADMFTRNIDADLNTLFNIYVIFYDLDENYKLNIETYYGISLCNPDDFPAFKDQMTTIITDYKNNNNWSTYCLTKEEKKKFTIAQPYGSASSSGIKLVIQDCNNLYRTHPTYPYMNSNSEDLNFPECSEARSYYTNAFIFKIDMIDSFNDYKEFSNPTKYHLHSIVKTVSLGLTRNIFIQLGKEILSSDVGWILEKKVVSSNVFINNIRDEPYLSGSLNYLLNLQIEFSNKITKSSRLYVKIQEIFARIGGLFNAGFLILKLGIYDYVRYKFRVNFAQYTVEATDDIDHIKQGISEEQKSIDISIKHSYDNGNSNIQNIIKSNRSSHSHSIAQKRCLEGNENDNMHSNSNISKSLFKANNINGDCKSSSKLKNNMNQGNDINNDNDNNLISNNNNNAKDIENKNKFNNTSELEIMKSQVNADMSNYNKSLPYIKMLNRKINDFSTSYKDNKREKDNSDLKAANYNSISHLVKANANKNTTCKQNHLECVSKNSNKSHTCNLMSNYKNYIKTHSIKEDRSCILKNNFLFSLKDQSYDKIQQNNLVYNHMVNHVNQEFTNNNLSIEDQESYKTNEFYDIKTQKQKRQCLKNNNEIYSGNINVFNDINNINDMNIINTNDNNKESDYEFTTANNIRNTRHPSNFITYHDIKFNDDLETEIKKKCLLEHVKDLNYFKYICSKIFSCRACRGNSYLGIKIIDKSVTRENYSFREYLLFRFQINTLIDGFQALQKRVVN